MLLPIIDLISHSADPNVAISSDSSGQPIIKARRAIRAGEELCLCYGKLPEHSPEELFVRYDVLDTVV